MTAIRCDNLCKYFTQGDTVVKGLDHLSIDIERGSFVCLSGPSGSGKTTLLNAIGGLDELDEGSISIDGERVDQMSAGELADLRLNHIGFVFQAYNLIPVLSARENVEFVMQAQGIPAASAGKNPTAYSKKLASRACTTAGRRNCPAASNSAWPWPARLSASPNWCWRTNRPPTWTPSQPRT